MGVVAEVFAVDISPLVAATLALRVAIANPDDGEGVGIF